MLGVCHGKLLTGLTKSIDFAKLTAFMPRNDALKKEGIVIEALRNAIFRIQLTTGEEVLAHLSGKLRLHRIKILNGDKVLVELSSYDPKRGRIVYRL